MPKPWKSIEEQRAYHRAHYWRHKAVKNPNRTDPPKYQGRTKHDDGPNRRCVGCGVLKPRTKDYFEPRKLGFRERCLECRKEARSDAMVSRRWGLTKELYEQYVRKGNCHICGSNMPLMAVDHCHKSEKPRGVLCRGCNTGLGCFKDNPLLLEAAAAYLRKS